MARVEKNLFTEGARGKAGNMVYKKINGKTFMTKAPDRSNVKYNKEQKDYRKLFKAASKFASDILHDPQKADRYLKRGIKQEKIYYTAIKDFYREHSWKKEKQHPTVATEYLRLFPGLTTRQAKAVKHLINTGRLTNAIYQRINNISKTSSTRELQNLVDKKAIIFNGVKGAGAAYKLFISELDHGDDKLDDLLKESAQNNK